MDPVLNDCILIVDGNLNFRERLAQEFRSANYKVLTTSTGEEGLFHLEAPVPPNRLVLQPCRSCRPNRRLDLGR